MSEVEGVVSEQTLYIWRNYLLGLGGGADIKRLRQLQQRNVRLKKRLADRACI